jgi:hypothetical protein
MKAETVRGSASVFLSAHQPSVLSAFALGSPDRLYVQSPPAAYGVHFPLSGYVYGGY